jgi:hypothetical protein
MDGHARAPTCGARILTEAQFAFLARGPAPIRATRWQYSRVELSEQRSELRSTTARGGALL